MGINDKDWDCFVDKNTKGIAIKNGNEQIAQDVASSVRVWVGDCVFDKERGVEYNNPEKIRDTLSFDMEEQAKRITGVDNAVVSYNGFENRVADATIYVQTTDGESIEVR